MSRSNRNNSPLQPKGYSAESAPDPLALAQQLQDQAASDAQAAQDKADAKKADAEQTEADALRASQEALIQGQVTTTEALVPGETVLAPAPLVPLDTAAVITELQGGSVEPEPVVAQTTVEPEPTRPPTIQARMTAHNNLAQARQDTPEVATSSDFSVEAEFEAMMTKERQQGTPVAIALVLFMDRYVTEMAPRRPQSTETILRSQESLFFKIMEVIERSPTREFDRLWRILIAYFRAYSTQCFSPRYMARGSREWRRSSDDFDLFSRLMNLLHASGTDRREDVSIDLTARTGLSEEGRGRLVSFYTR